MFDRIVLARASLVAVGAFLVACGGDDATSGGGTGGASNGVGGSGGAPTGSGDAGGGAAGSGGASTSADPGSPHLPPHCHDGFVACGDVCARLDDDSRHCGACGHTCAVGSGCVGGSCVAGQDCAFPGITCGGGCSDLRFDAANCGSCENRCADAALCVANGCRDAGGDGQSCGAPLAWDADPTREQVGFHFSPPLTELHAFSCASVGALPTRWFGFTATQGGTDVEIRSSGADDYVLEVFSAASCAPADVIGCDDDSEAPDPKVKGTPTVAGDKYWIAVGLKGDWSGEPAVIRVDF